MFKKAIILAGLLVANNVYAHQEWDKSGVYQSGDIVTWKGETFVSTHWTQGKEPQVNNINWDGWLYIDKGAIESWSPNSTYHGGDVVSHNNSYFLASWWNQNKVPSDSSVWREIKGLDSGTPPPPPEDDTVLGVDKDKDGIRDDFQLAVNQQYSDEDRRRIVLATSFEWKKVIEVSLSQDVVLNESEAADMFTNLLSIEECFQQIKQQDPSFEYPHSLYFNTLDRALQKRRGQARIHKMMNDRRDLIQWPTDPCQGYK